MKKFLLNVILECKNSPARPEIDAHFEKLQDEYIIHQVVKIDYHGTYGRNEWLATLLVSKKESEINQFQYHGRAKDMPKRLREYFDSKGVKFADDEMVDVVEYVEIELVNRWKAGN